MPNDSTGMPPLGIPGYGTGTVYDPGKWLHQPYTTSPDTITTDKIPSHTHDLNVTLDLEQLKKFREHVQSLQTSLRDAVGSGNYLKLRKLIARVLNIPENGNQVHYFMQIFYGKHEEFRLARP
jgi:hypothetical protein